MKRTLLAFSVVAALAAPSAHAADTHPFSVNDLLAMERLGDPRVSPDGRWVAFTVRTTDMEANKGRTDVWLLDLATKGTRRLTTHEANDTNPRFAPDGRSVFFLSTRSGSSQVWTLPLDGGEAGPVTKLPVDVDAFEVFPEGRRLLLAMAVFPGRTPEETKAAMDEKDKVKASGKVYDELFVRHWDAWADGTRNHLFVYDLAARKAKDLMPALKADCPSRPFGGLEETAVSPDGKTVVFSARDAGREEAWSTNFDLFEVPADGSGAPRKTTTNPAWDSFPAYSPDGKTLAYLAMRRAGFEADRFDVVLRDLATRKERTIVVRVDDTKNGDRSLGGLLWSADGREIYGTADSYGNQALLAVDVASGKTRVVVAKGHVAAPQLLRGGRLLFLLDSLLGPAEIHHVSPTGGDATKVTSFNDACVSAARFGQPEPFTFKGWNGETVWGWLVKPADFDPAKKYPVAFLVHGGPQGSFGNDFHYRWNPQTYAGAGYAAVMVDFHGSTGYGQDFTDAIRDDWGGKPYEDLMKGLDAALAKWSFLDGSRAAALGASYGGYMVNWIAGHTDRFKCLVSHAGNLDERTAYYMTEELWFPEWEHGGVEFASPKGYVKQSPIDFVKNWKTPTLVTHGMKDYRIAYAQGIATFTALQRKGIPSRLIVYPDENHWIQKPHNSKQWHDAVLAWLGQWVK